MGSIFLATLRGVYHLGKLAKDKEARDKQVDDHEVRIGKVEEVVVIHGQASSAATLQESSVDKPHWLHRVEHAVYHHRMKILGLAMVVLFAGCCASARSRPGSASWRFTRSCS